MRRGLVTLGIVLIAVGLLWPWLSRIGWGRLPGDIVLERGHGRFYFPITTCLVISALVSFALWWWRR
ncbi:MAG: DUF2905 domain-containing protein [Gammaproteobacteria bacterium]